MRDFKCSVISRNDKRTVARAKYSRDARDSRLDGSGKQTAFPSIRILIKVDRERGRQKSLHAFHHHDSTVIASLSTFKLLSPN